MNLAKWASPYSGYWCKCLCGLTRRWRAVRWNWSQAPAAAAAVACQFRWPPVDWFVPQFGHRHWASSTTEREHMWSALPVAAYSDCIHLAPSRWFVCCWPWMGCSLLPPVASVALIAERNCSWSGWCWDVWDAWSAAQWWHSIAWPPWQVLHWAAGSGRWSSSTAAAGQLAVLSSRRWPEELMGQRYSAVAWTDVPRSAADDRVASENGCSSLRLCVLARWVDFSSAQSFVKNMDLQFDLPAFRGPFFHWFCDCFPLINTSSLIWRLFRRICCCPPTHTCTLLLHIRTGERALLYSLCLPHSYFSTRTTGTSSFGCRFTHL